MNLKSGQDSPKPTETSAPSQEQQLKESSNSKIRSTGESSLVPLDPKPGEMTLIKNHAVSTLVDTAEAGVKKLSDEEKQVLSKFVENTSRGFAASLGMICKGPKCPFLSACPINEIGGTLPIDRRCPVESSIVTLWVNKHLKSLGIDNPDDPIHSFDMDMLYELAGQELIRWRCSVHLSDKPLLVENKLVGYSNDSQPIFADVINPVLEVMERAGRNILKIREALVATREAQVKAGQVASDPTLRASELREKAFALSEKRRKDQESIKEANFTIKDK